MGDALIDKVSEILTRSFADASPRLDRVGGNGRVWGVLVSPEFEGVEQIDRQERLWRVLKSSLSPEEQLRVSAILSMTPTEVSDD